MVHRDQMPHIRTLRASLCGVVPRTRRRIGNRVFSVAAPRAWNRLPTELRSTDSFRRDLKHFCFILSTGTRIRIDSVMRPRSSSRGRNKNASVTVTVTVGVTALNVWRRLGILKFWTCLYRDRRKTCKLIVSVQSGSETHAAPLTMPTN